MVPLDLCLVKTAATVLLLAVLWSWETWLPLYKQRRGRLRHAGHNLALALVNTVVLAAAFGAAIVWVADWTEQRRIGLLHALDFGAVPRFLLALVLLDAWMYVWHRANHALPWLWRFHRVHHSDTQMDVTTATRFHLGEHIGSVLLRLGLIPLAGFEAWQLVLYDTLVIGVTQLHHANISLGRLDWWLRWLIVTPDLHKVHHSRLMPETNSNYSTVLSIWDRLAGTLRQRRDASTIEFGLDEFRSPRWQTFFGLLATPFVRSGRRPPDEMRSRREAQLLLITDNPDSSDSLEAV